ncbi:MAG TPA: orotate phosphoribosyltransferase [Betaproteobacteria bacterium]|jgi:orotate phosphoribosyltransferase|nr:orotate phosphoribosyltransferase [Burkholderiales bacterium]HBZ17892.1 orotate phosphoribosyltransferase [Betaproteobacteria bacterium]
MTSQIFSKVEFIEFTLKANVLRFGDFTTKAGRQSPYFFNAGLFTDGVAIAKLGQFYAQAILNANIEFDMLYGPAYKGITLSASTAIALAGFNRNVPFAFNRKELKDHGEGGLTIGAPVSGKVLIVDDVISAGTSVRESIEVIEATGATPCGIVISLDRQERGTGAESAIQQIQRDFGLPVINLFCLDDLVDYLSQKPEMANNLSRVCKYREEYGAA